MPRSRTRRVSYPDAVASVFTALSARSSAISAVSAAIQGTLLVGYAVSIGILALTRGVEGPAEVASSTGVAVEVVTFALLGGGALVVAYGRWGDRSWSNVPFVVLQLLALTVGVPMALGAGSGVPAGALVSIAALVGLGTLMAGAVSGPDDPDAPADGLPQTEQQRSSTR